MPVENISLDYMIFLNQHLNMINAELAPEIFKGLTIQFEGMVIDSNYHFDNLMPINKQKREWKLV